MFGLSFTHLIILAVLALVVLGPEQLPEMARTIARLLNEWKRATSDIQTSLSNTLRDENFNKPIPPVVGEVTDTSEPPAPAEELPPHEPGHYDPDESGNS